MRDALLLRDAIRSDRDIAEQLRPYSAVDLAGFSELVRRKDEHRTAIQQLARYTVEMHPAAITLITNRDTLHAEVDRAYAELTAALDRFLASAYALAGLILGAVSLLVSLI